MKQEGVKRLLSLVLVVLGIAFAGYLVVPDMGRPGPDCADRLRAIHQYLFEYSVGHDWLFPDSLDVLRNGLRDHLRMVSPSRREEEGRQIDALFVCPIAHRRGIPASEDGYEYIGMGLRLKEIKDSPPTPVVFDRAGNHADNTRTVAFAGWGDADQEPVKLMLEDDFRKVLVQAIRSGAYPQTTVEKLRKDEPWLAKELAGE